MKSRNTIMIQRKNFLFIVLSISLFTWYSCSRRMPPSKSNINYSESVAGIDRNNVNYVELISNKYIISTQDWVNLAYSNKNISFIELKIDDIKKHKEKYFKKNKEYPNSIKIIELRNKKHKKQKELTVLFIHGLGGKEGDFFSIIKNLAEQKFNGRINLISGKRFDSCTKSINQQTNEVEKKLSEYLGLYSKKKKHKLLIVGHSQGGIIGINLLNKLVNNSNFEICGLILVGTPLKGIDATKRFMDEQRKVYPNIISAIEKSIFGCSLDKNPKGVLDTINKNVISLVNEGNENIKNFKIPTKVIIGCKPNNIEYPNSFFAFLKKLFRLMNKNILRIGSVKKDISASKIGETFKELMHGIPQMKKIFNAKKLAGEKENDFLLSKGTQTWSHKNDFVQNITLRGVVHNWKISLLVSENANPRISTELESPRTVEHMKEMIDDIMNSKMG
ncbi:MAG: hypothetical protein GY830_04825 [Bacteroidetes bacterium]|nr:hypothetical protein [Bacteroidota bacterium]